MTAQLATEIADLSPAAIPATHQIHIDGIWRDALSVAEVAPRLFGSSAEAAQLQVRRLIRSGQLRALTTGAQYLIPVDAYIEFLRGSTRCTNPTA